MTLYLYPGSWNPLHAGHLSIAQYVEQKYQHNCELIFELCTRPYDKSRLEDCDIRERRRQFEIIGRKVVLSEKTSFLQKALDSGFYLQYSLPSVLKYFIVGHDTVKRIDDPKYYYDSVAERDRCLDLIDERRWKFLVFPRNGNITNGLSDKISEMCVFCTDFVEQNISSTEIRNTQIPLSLLCIGDYFEYNGNIYSHEGYSSDGNYVVATINGEEFFDIGLNTLVIRKYKK